MTIKTGHTVYEMVVSLNSGNNPLSTATFTDTFFINGTSTTAVTLSISLSDASRGIFSASFSAATVGFHQFELKNDLTNVVYISDAYDVRPDNEIDTTIYVGL